MDPKINRRDLPDIVEEAARLEAESEEEIAPSEAKQILRELDLPEGRLDEAREAVAVRQSARTTTKRNVAIAGVVAAAVLSTALYIALSGHATSEALAAMTVSSSAITLHGAPVAAVLPRSSSPELSFDVVLAGAPREPIALSCDWTAPDGTVHFQNYWKTKSVDKDIWPTHCRHTFRTTEAAGGWTVAMKEEGRLLAKGGFTLE